MWAEIVICNAALCWLLASTLLEVLDVSVDTSLLSHDASNVDLVGIVLILDKSRLDGLLQPLRVNRQVTVGNQIVNRIIAVDHHLLGCFIFLRRSSNLRCCIWFHLVGWLFLVHVIGFSNDLTMSSRGGETLNVLIQLVSQVIWVHAEKRLCSHDFHWHYCVQLALQFLLRSMILSGRLLLLLFVWLRRTTSTLNRRTHSFGMIPHLVSFSLSEDCIIGCSTTSLYDLFRRHLLDASRQFLWASCTRSGWTFSYILRFWLCAVIHSRRWLIPLSYTRATIV